MGTRRRARECALQLLYMWEFHRDGGGYNPELFWAENRDDEVTSKAFASELVGGVVAEIDKVDDLIRQASLNWRIDRMATVDRNVLRVATYELICQPDTPLKVVLNEAIEMSKRFGSEDSGAFVNGVLDKIGSILRPGSRRKSDEPGDETAGSPELDEDLTADEVSSGEEAGTGQ